MVTGGVIQGPLACSVADSGHTQPLPRGSTSQAVVAAVAQDSDEPLTAMHECWRDDAPLFR